MWRYRGRGCRRGCRGLAVPLQSGPHLHAEQLPESHALDLRLLPPHRGFLVFDVMLGIMGTAATVSAAHHFGGTKGNGGGGDGKGGGSGVLDADATVSRSEMVEHAFYQLLNLTQVLMLHAMAWLDGAELPPPVAAAAVAVAAACRGGFHLPPVHQGEIYQHPYNNHQTFSMASV